MVRVFRPVTLVTLGVLCMTALPRVFAVTASPVAGIDLPAASVIPGQYIVLMKDGRASTVDEVLKEHGIVRQKVFSTIGGFASTLKPLALKALQNDPRVAIVEPDYKVYAFITYPPWWPKPRSSSSSSLSSSSSSRSSSTSSSSSRSSSSLSASSSPSSSSAQPLPTGINRIDAELNAVAKIDGIDERVNADVAVIDTGVQGDHPDLNVYAQVNFTSESNAADGNGHGTHVAGTAAALDNTIGVVGVAPGARIWGVKVLDKGGSGTMSDIIEGVDYVTAHAAEIEVANMSLGCKCDSAALNAAISRSVAAGVVYVVAAGNSAVNASTFTPANHPDVIAVSAVADFNGLAGGGAASTCYSDVDDTLANFSNFGSIVDIAAPGVCITSTWKGSSYNTISGTSMASPHVAGAVALYLSHNAKPTDAAGVAAVRDALRNQGFQNAFTGDPDGVIEPLLNAAGL